ncbi:MAG: VacJ family lipoprotein [Candidatus Binataceae bacterium]
MRGDNERVQARLASRVTATASLLVALAFAAQAFAQDVAPLSNNPTRQGAVGQAENLPPGENQGVYSDPLAPFNESMFTFNLKLDDWVLRPVASGYAAIAPLPVRQSVGRFFDNVNVIPRFANNLFQLRLPEAGTEVARFGINTTLGVAGLFDPADAWFGLKEHPDDFGLTLRYYGCPTGPYLMLPFFGPSTVSDTVGLAVDAAMNPVSYLTYIAGVPWWVPTTVSVGWRLGEAINYRSEHLDQFEEADRFAVDLYGAVQDYYLQDRENKTKELHE